MTEQHCQQQNTLSNKEEESREAPPGTTASYCPVDAGGAEEDANEEENCSSSIEKEELASSMYCRQFSLQYYSMNDNDIGNTDEYNDNMGEIMEDYSRCQDEEDEYTNDEVLSAQQRHSNGQYYQGEEDYHNDVQEGQEVEFFDHDGMQQHDGKEDDGDYYHDNNYALVNNSGEEGGDGEMNDGYYHHHYPFDIGNLQQLQYPPSLDFGTDDNRYGADDEECHFDNEDFGHEEEEHVVVQNEEDDNDDEYNHEDRDEYYDQRDDNVPQLSAESLDVVHRIEVIMKTIVAALDKLEVPKIQGYKGSISTHDDNDEDNDDDSYEEANAIIASNLLENGDQKFCRTWGNTGQCRTFTSICLVLSFIHQLLLSMRTTTTREVYYVFVTHFRSQRECDSTILDCAKILGVSRRSLGLSASPKGWFCGCVEITRKGTLPSGKDVSGSIDGTALSSIQGLPITREWIERDEAGRNDQGVHIGVTSKNAKCILVIEKEGVYNRLSEERLYDRFPCIMVTGKGVPDLASRALVKTLHDELELPVVGLCDMNPYGISVLSVYHCAGNRMGVDGNYRYSVPIEWMGLRPTEVNALHEKHRFPDTVFQTLTDLDRKRIESLTDEMSLYLDDDEKDEVADNMKYKVELEALYWLGADFMGQWVYKQLQNRFAQV